MFKPLTFVQLVPSYSSQFATNGEPPVAKPAVCVPAHEPGKAFLAVFKLFPSLQLEPLNSSDVFEGPAGLGAYPPKTKAAVVVPCLAAPKLYLAKFKFGALVQLDPLYVSDALLAPGRVSLSYRS